MKTKIIDAERIKHLKRKPRLREALEKTQTVLNTVDLSRLEYQDRSKFYDVVFIDGIIDKALKGGKE